MRRLAAALTAATLLFCAVSCSYDEPSALLIGNGTDDILRIVIDDDDAGLIASEAPEETQPEYAAITTDTSPAVTGSAESDSAAPVTSAPDTIPPETEPPETVRFVPETEPPETSPPVTTAPETTAAPPVTTAPVTTAAPPVTTAPETTAAPPETTPPVTSAPAENQTDTVYWVKNGGVWHLRRDCSSLSRSKEILSGTVDEAIAAGKERVCKLCGK